LPNSFVSQVCRNVLPHTIGSFVLCENHQTHLLHHVLPMG